MGNIFYKLGQNPMRLQALWDVVSNDFSHWSYPLKRAVTFHNNSVDAVIFSSVLFISFITVHNINMYVGLASVLPFHFT